MASKGMYITSIQSYIIFSGILYNVIARIMVGILSVTSLHKPTVNRHSSEHYEKCLGALFLKRTIQESSPDSG
jgi:hypothetical protein